jgi:UDP-glucose 4-epimerase
MNILVTGGAGFIGSHIAEYFAAAGHNVTVLDNLSTGYLRNIPKSDNITFMEGDS